MAPDAIVTHLEAALLKIDHTLDVGEWDAAWSVTKCYLDNMTRHCNDDLDDIALAVLVHATALIFRLVELGVNPYPGQLPHVILTAIYIANKMVDDDPFTTAYFAKLGNVTAAELIFSEREMAASLMYRCHVDRDEHATTLANLNLSF